MKTRTIYLKSIKSPAQTKSLLKRGSNRKLGDVITKGKWKGMPIYSLTLEERATCPKTCQQWENCYGNNMPFAHRVDHTDAGFTAALSNELGNLAERHKGGFVVRLHVLGDFFSEVYVAFWTEALKTWPNLKIYGYTHRLPTSKIGKAIEKLNAAGAWIRWSDAGDVEMAANVEGPGITCPEQTGKTASCATCGLCWSVKLPINFLEH